jgi:GntR family transcriptional repressor for pyruvate dehydrogenase complex
MADDAIVWRPVRRLRAHELILERIEEEIKAGRLGVGDRLPGERQLADMLRVSRASVREALRVLEALGVLTAKSGSGPGAGAILTARPADGLGDLIRLHIGLSNFSPAEVVEARAMVERSAAGFAAVAAGETELARLRDALEQMEDTSLTLAEFNAIDTEFHVRVGEASKNRLVGQFMQALRDAVRRQAIEAIAGLGEWPETAGSLRADHVRIFEAIASGDPVEATAAVDAHIRHAYPGIPRHEPKPAARRQARPSSFSTPPRP